jgi:hypothetical protein
MRWGILAVILSVLLLFAMRITGLADFSWWWLLVPSAAFTAGVVGTFLWFMCETP